MIYIFYSLFCLFLINCANYPDSTFSVCLAAFECVVTSNSSVTTADNPTTLISSTTNNYTLKSTDTEIFELTMNSAFTLMVNVGAVLRMHSLDVC
jgi:hypothetical protein